MGSAWTRLLQLGKTCLDVGVYSQRQIPVSPLQEQPGCGTLLPWLLKSHSPEGRSRLLPAAEPATVRCLQQI